VGLNYVREFWKEEHTEEYWRIWKNLKEWD